MTPEEDVRKRVHLEPSPASVAHLGDGMCWMWTGSLTSSGYGARRPSGAHRWAYMLLVGPIPEGLHLDHLCKRKPCVAPHHLEPVTPAENFNRSRAEHAQAVAAKRKTHCKFGHEFTPENTISGTKPRGRQCRECHRRVTRDRHRRLTAERKASS